MGRPGPKGKPVLLRLVDGTHDAYKHGDRAKAREMAEQSRAAFGALERPAFLRGEARRAWDTYIAPATWLDRSREAAAIAFCELWAEFRFHPPTFPAAKHGQMRAYMGELGLTDERNRVVEGMCAKDEFFDS
jgi:hypothetical protein